MWELVSVSKISVWWYKSKGSPANINILSVYFTEKISFTYIVEEISGSKNRFLFSSILADVNKVQDLFFLIHSTPLQSLKLSHNDVHLFKLSNFSVVIELKFILSLSIIPIEL